MVSDTGEKKKIRLQMDPGSDMNLMCRYVANDLNLPGEPQEMTMEKTLNTYETVKHQRIVEFRLQKLDGSFTSMKIPAYTVPVICSKMKPIKINPKDYPHLSKVKYTEQLPMKEKQEIQLLLGEPYCNYLETGNKKALPDHKNPNLDIPSALETRLGWCLSGGVPKDKRVTISRFKFTILKTKKVDEDDVETFWKQENIGIEAPNDDPMTLDEKEALEKMEETAVYDPIKKFWTVSLLWIDEKIQYTGVEAAKAVARRMEQVLKGQPAKAEEMNRAFRELEDNKFVDELPPQAELDENAYFVQIHGVFRDVTSTRCRLCLNAAACHGPDKKSINEHLHQGPTLLADMTQLLMRFRVNKVAYCADISKMYLRLRLSKQDQPYCRYFWRHMNTNVPFRVFQYNRISFGYRDSPFKAIWVVKKQAENMKNQFPEAAQVLQEDLYMDDVCSGSETAAQAAQTIKDITHILSEADLPLHKIISNDEDVVKDLPEEMKSQEKRIKVLGIWWDSEKDTISIKFNPVTDHKTIQTPTKRGLLQRIATTFDALGLIQPFIMQAKILMQRTWHPEPLDWDDKLPEEILKPYQEWVEQFEQLEEFEMPRKTIPDDYKPSFLAICSDASQLGLGVSAYLVSKNKKRESHSCLVFAKSRIIDRSQKWTIPRMELAAALLGARVGKFVKEAFKMDKCFYFSDSDVCLWWIKNQNPMDMRMWIGNRLREIQTLTKPNQWYYVNTADNPADLASRGCSMPTLKNHPTWWTGPKQLVDDSIKWKETSQLKTNAQIKAEGADEYKKETSGKIKKTTESDKSLFAEFAKRNSSWVKSVRQVCYLNRFLAWIRRNKTLKYPWKLHNKSIDVQEFRRGEKILFRKTQEEAFPEEFKLLKKQAEDNAEQKLPKESPLFRLSPQFDLQQRLIVVKHRLSDSDLFQDLILLPNKLKETEDGRIKKKKKTPSLKNHPITEQLVRFHHEVNLHAPMATTHSILRHKVWILGGRKAITTFLFGCRCRKPVPITQKMGPLPNLRAEAFHSFESVSTDYFGPLTAFTKDDEENIIGSHKCYGLLFTCFNTRAVKLYLVKNLTTEKFFDAFTLLTIERGRPSNIYSDHARTYKRANKELKILLQKIDWKKLKNQEVVHGTEWTFSTELAPNTNGLTERMVRSCKEALRSAIRNAKLTYDQLNIVCKEVEGVVNQRPIGFFSDMIDNPRGITPFELINGRSKNPHPDPTSYKGMSAEKVWALRRKILNNFWKIWSHNYLNDLLVNKKWNAESKIPIEKGLRVLIKDRNLSRNDWRQGLVIATHPNKNDGLIRRVTLRTPTGSIISRSVRDLAYYEDSLINTPNLDSAVIN